MREKQTLPLATAHAPRQAIAEVSQAVAIEAFRDWIAGETLTVEWLSGDGADLSLTDVDGHELAFRIASV